MPRKTDEEILAEIKQQREAEEKEKKPFKKLKDYDESFEGNDDADEDNDVPEIQPKNQPQIVEREINLALINDKLNYIISKVQQI